MSAAVPATVTARARGRSRLTVGRCAQRVGVGGCSDYAHAVQREQNEQQHEHEDTSHATMRSPACACDLGPVCRFDAL